ncbi:hypothetical protein VTL71DRAFT_8423 [Oculimacula yallundae]|uniref:Uncharacterized protein n=1 Tax=Oculimacula yallundae TaxID=86028 RepID=A0ABR4CZY1_9HELO
MFATTASPCAPCEHTDEDVSEIASKFPPHPVYQAQNLNGWIRSEPSGRIASPIFSILRNFESSEASLDGYRGDEESNG